MKPLGNVPSAGPTNQTKALIRLRTACPPGPDMPRYTSGMNRWYVYLIECRDGSLYTGIATDVDRRYAEHVAGKGARYTRSRPPLRLLARFGYPDRATASRAEYAIKQLTPARKRALCATGDVAMIPGQAGSAA